jgi:hypothetical protein
MAKESDNVWFDENVDNDVAEAVIRLKVVLPNRKGEIDRDFRPDVSIDYDDLERQMSVMPSVFAFWSSVLAEQRAEVAKTDRIIKARRALLARKLFDEHVDIPKWRLEEIIESDSNLTKLETKLIQAKRTESKLFAIVDSLRMKSDMLRSLAGFKRQELQDAR